MSLIGALFIWNPLTTLVDVLPSCLVDFLLPCHILAISDSIRYLRSGMMHLTPS